MALSAEEQHRVDMIVDFVRQHRVRLVSGAVVFFVALATWLVYDSRRAGIAEASARLHYELREAIEEEDSAKVDEIFARIAETGNPSYVELSGMAAANFRFWKGDKEGAEKAYREVLAVTDDPAMEAVASLRLAQTLIDLGRPGDALRLVDGREPASETFALLFGEMTGDALAAMGEHEKARERYIAVLEGILPVHGLAYEALIISKLGMVSQEGVDLAEVESDV